GDRSRDRDEQLQLPNLLNDIEALTALLVGQIESAHWLDAYLLACGIDQILEDALHRDLLMLGRITRQLQHRVGGNAGRLAGATAASARVGAWAVCGRWLGAS